MFAISYFSDSEEEFNSDEVLFEIEVEALYDLNNEELFTVSSDMTKAEAYRGYAEVVPFNSVTLLQPGNRILGVYPNPWAENTAIDFEINKPGEAQWEFYDAQGRLIYNSKSYYPKGKHSLEIEGSNLDVQGVIFIKLKTTDDVAEFKMVKL